MSRLRRPSGLMLPPFLFALAAALILLLVAPVRAAQPLVLEEFFRGRTVAEGVFESRIAGVRREFKVYLHGTWDPKTFTLRLREDFVYADGEKDTKVWFFQKVGDRRYIGTRSDVLAPTHVTPEGNSLVFSYAAEVPVGDDTIALRFNDTLTPIDARTVRNTANVVKYGITVGTVELIFTRP
ncbi:DUF3833 family protein [Microvirga tunisiensis]|uniref:DUF3833 family protein n=2 Tax=Pannonibacter tanglangensis TaxID=2750084 RepID=A0ABW9ZDI4_9HYPH|nr:MULTISPECIES: DUF3833 family protein [unclassified Pannonibacter]NBN62905.1 DUF3833 family protein [Pannonibacter sp. XCT-34]NBN78479.1 DUF3833 family protein [Pannonibacter sp. XCT-53]